MLLYPLWIFFPAAAAAFLMGRFRTGRLAVTLLSFFVSLSAAMVFAAYLFHGGPRIMALPANILVFRIDASAAAASLCACLISAAAVLAAPRWSPNHGTGRAEALLLAFTGLAVGAACSAGVSSILFFVEVAYLIFVVVMRKTAAFPGKPKVHQALFVAPAIAAVLALMVWALVVRGVSGRQDLFLLVLPVGAAVYVLWRILLVPLSLSPGAMTKVLADPLLTVLALMCVFAASALPAKLPGIYTPVCLALLPASAGAAGIYLAMLCRGGNASQVMARIFCAEAACLVGGLSLKGMVDPSVAIHVQLWPTAVIAAAVGLALVFRGSGGLTGRAKAILSIVFIASLMGLFPLAGLAERIALFGTAVADGGSVAAEAVIVFILGLVPLVFAARLYPLARELGKDGRLKVGMADALFIAFVLAALYLPLYLRAG